MFRIFIGSVLGGIVQWLIGAIAWVSPLGKLAFRSLDEAHTADLQVAMARTLTATGSGTYFIPSPETSAGTALLGRGPVGLVFFNTEGFPPMDWASILTGLVMSVVMLLVIGVALSLIDTYAARLKAMMLFGAAAIFYFVLSLPVYNFYMPWGWWIFLGIQEAVAFAAGGFILVRWFMPAGRPAVLP